MEATADFASSNARLWSCCAFMLFGIKIIQYHFLETLNKLIYTVPIDKAITLADNLKGHEKNHSFWDRLFVLITESCVHRSTCHVLNITIVGKIDVIDKIHDFSELFFKLFESEIWFLCHIFIWIDFESYHRIELRFTPKESS